jgi:acyl-CoA dehydrogenase
MSDTEREAIEAGTVWWDAELFSGKPDWRVLHAQPKAVLSGEEQAFLDGPVEALCHMIDDWQVNFELRNLPPEVWAFIGENGFFGMIIPKAYGGLGFSALAHSAVVSKIATRSIVAAVTVMVPNSLGPAELLLHYGTDEQKKYYLPSLARGEELPCFALTGPYAGSDAASLPDHGVVCYQDVDGKKTLGMRVTWEKRYITLGPVATLLGLAFRLSDPDHILGDQEELGITLALVPTDTPGVNIGRRHFPARQAFQNGPNSGKDVFFPMEWVIGGQGGIGQGWRMLMESLSAGRSISLPSLSTGAAKFCARTTGAYARIRKQFRVPIGRFEGVEEALARIAGNAYLLEAARRVTAMAVDQGEKPAVLSAIVKYHATERMRQVVDDALDVHGGRAICDGPSNYLANIYYSIPVSITVEGANILTRSLIIFGQGAIRCHPYLLKEMQAATNADETQGLVDFDKALFGHLGFVFGNLFRALFHNLTGGAWAGAPEAGPVTPFYRQLSRASASFAVVADLTLALLGGELKRREMLSARLGDVLSEMYLMSTALKRFEDDERKTDDLPLLRWCCETGFKEIERRMDEILNNFPSRVLGFLLRAIIFPWGRHRKGPSDRLTQACARLILEPSATRDRLTAGIFVGHAPDDLPARLDATLKTVIAADAIEDKIRDAVGRRLFAADPVSAAAEALEKGVITKTEVELLERAAQEIRSVIMVDDFDPQQLTGSA